MEREFHNAAGVILFRAATGGRRYLLLRSALTKSRVWEFAKGGIEPGESELDAARRELQEETGMASGDYVLLERFREEERYVFTRGTGAGRRLVVKRVVYFLAETAIDRVRLSKEASEYRWAVYDEARALLRFREKRQVLDLAEQWLEDGGQK